jgi:hypothetical protein
MAWAELNFEKYKGETLPQVIFKNPDWFFWAYENKLFKGTLAKEAEEIYRKACSIRVPQERKEPMEVEYIIDSRRQKFSDMQLVPISKPEHVGSSFTLRSRVIDLSLPRKIAPYDKQGGNQMIRRVKYYLFGNSSYIMTKQRCEDFFENDGNFDFTDRSSK